MMRFMFPKLLVASLVVSLCAFGCSGEESDSAGENTKTTGAQNTGGPTSGPIKSPEPPKRPTPQASKSVAKTPKATPNKTTPSTPSQQTGTTPSVPAVVPAPAPSAVPAPTAPKTTSNATVKLDLLDALSSKTTLGFAGVVGIPELFQFIDAQLSQILTKIPMGSIPEEVKSLLNKTTRDAFIGFDLTTTAGWETIGIDISGGLFILADDKVVMGNEPAPMIALKFKDRKKFIQFVSSKGAPPITFSNKKGASELGSSAGGLVLIGEKGGYTFILPGVTAPDGAAERTAFDAFLKGDGTSLTQAGVASKALGAGTGKTRVMAFMNTEGFNDKIDAMPANEKQIMRFIADRFPGVGLTSREGGGSLKVVARADALASLRKILRPRTAPQLSKYVPQTGWVASRFSINLDTLFQGISEFIPPSNFQAKMAVMSAPMMLAGIGLDWTMLSGALDGHVLLGISLNGVSKVLQQQAGLEQAVLVLGVKDEAKADRLLSTLVEMIKKQGAGAPPVEQVTIGGQPGYVIKAGEINPAAVRVGKAIIMATSVADAERTIAVSTGANLSTTPAGRVLDEHDAFVSQTVDVKDYANAIASMMDGMGDPELKTAVDAMRKALQNQKEPAVFQMAFRLDDGLELRLDGLDKIMPMVIGVLTEVAPTFMK